ncbi:Zn(II)2Cys6 transcription factor domain-containing protein [Aspergillus stella-maris]|uniref:Zn(II)2Cys6 transcription factor domain-containing protein n=1 Tax=Aspergillus stella-maris TaxID=1810926 RepID=UPI003CCDD232
MTSTQRRQNSSCDPCRKVKRRCFFAPSTDGIATTCVNCQRRGKTCTFDFAISKSTAKSTKRRGISSSEPSIWNNAPETHRQTESVVDGIPDATEWDAWLDLDVNQGNAVDLTEPNLSGQTDPNSLWDPSIFSPEPSTEASYRYIGAETDLIPLPPRAPTPPHRITSLLSGNPTRSPLYLLNARLDATIIDARLAQIHNTIITGSASRFAEFECNLYATVSRYRLDDAGAEAEESQGGLLPAAGSSSGLIEYRTSSERGKTPEAQPHIPTLGSSSPQMTALGIVRFLDQFSGLYGNRLSASASRQSNDTLKAVLRVFSMQWLSTSQNQAPDALADAYTDAWFQARSLLQSTQAQYIRSFRLIYALILFDGVAIPSKTRGSVPEHEFLCWGLETLLYLQRLVKKHCDILGPSSMYKSIFEASLSVVSWAGYIRDIGAALTGDHRCLLPCPDIGTKRLEASTPGDTMVQLARQVDVPVTAPLDFADLVPSLDGCVPTVCRGMVAQAFVVWREIIRVKELLSTPASVTSETLSHAISDAVIYIGRFNDTFDPFITQCIQSLHRLSIRSKISSISIFLPWNLSILILSESLKPLLTNTNTTTNNSIITTEISSHLQSYRRSATLMINKIATQILSGRPDETSTFNTSNGLAPDVSILAYHITPGLTALTFGKAIEGVLDLKSFSTSSGLTSQTGMESESWKKDIDALLAALSSLETTVGGKEVSRGVFDGLLGKYGDLICECWDGSGDGDGLDGVDRL